MITQREVLVELDDVYKRFGDVTAVNGIDFTVRQGEFFTLVGPSGCGKTTTLRMISGFEQPSEGSVRIESRPMEAVPPEARDTNLVFQHLSLFPHMTVGENVGYGLLKSGIDEESVLDGKSEHAVREERVKEYLELVDLDGFDSRDPTDLSGGQQQRVALARALINEPAVLLLDEPLSSLDRKLRKEMEVELRRIHNQTQGAFFYVTHDQEVAMSMSDRIAVMNNGRIEQVGPPEEIYREPATQFVAEFIGDTNLFDAEVVEKDGHTLAEIGGADGFAVPAGDRNGSVTVSIRPEDFRVAGAARSDGSGRAQSVATTAESAITGEVVKRYFQGDRTNYVVDPDISVEPVQVIVQGHNDAVDTGEQVTLQAEQDAAVVF